MGYTNAEVKEAVYVTKYEEIYANAYSQMWNSMAFIKDELARARAVNGFMVTFAQAIGMDQLGCVTLDEENGKIEDVSVFASRVGGSASSGGDYKPKNDMGYQTAPKPAFNSGGSGGEKKPYVPTGKPLEGDATDKQIDTITKYENSKNNELKNIVFTTYAKLGKEEAGQLTKDEASKLIDKLFAKSKELKAKKAQEEGEF